MTQYSNHSTSLPIWMLGEGDAPLPSAPLKDARKVDGSLRHYSDNRTERGIRVLQVSEDAVIRLGRALRVWR